MDREIHDTCATAETLVQKMKTLLDGEPLLPEKHQQELQTFLQGRLGGLIFRQVQRVFLKEADLREVNYFTSCGLNISKRRYQPREFALCSFDSKEHEQQLEYRYNRFSFLTAPDSMRDNDPYRGRQIYGASSNFSQLDIVKGCTFEFGPARKATVPPRKHDLMCMEVEEDEKGRLFAKRWFICSDQFLRFWTCIMYESHVSFGSFKGKRLRERLFSGNRLNTNSYLKWAIAHIQNDIAMDPAETEKRFYYLRTEYPAKTWVHVYAALVLMARYGELPTQENIPNNRDSGPHLTSWILPKGFIAKILDDHTSYTFTPEDVSRVNRVCTDIYFLRKETRKAKEFNLQTHDFPPLQKNEKKTRPFSRRTHVGRV